METEYYNYNSDAKDGVEPTTGGVCDCIRCPECGVITPRIRYTEWGVICHDCLTWHEVEDESMGKERSMGKKRSIDRPEIQHGAGLECLPMYSLLCDFVWSLDDGECPRFRDARVQSRGQLLAEAKAILARIEANIDEVTK